MLVYSVQGFLLRKGGAGGAFRLDLWTKLWILNQALDFNFVHVTVKKTLGLLIYNREIVLPHGAGIRSL